MKLLNTARCAFIVKVNDERVKVESGEVIEVSNDTANNLIACYPDAWKFLDKPVNEKVEEAKEQEEEVKEVKKTTTKKKK